MAHRTQHLRLASVMQKTAWLLLHRPVHRGNPRGGGVVVARRGDGDGAAAGVFQIITSSCGGGGLPW